MTEEATDLNPVPLVERLLEKTKAGKLGWEPTADRKAFVVSVGGESTFRIRLVQAEDIDMFGRPATVDVPVLDMLDENGMTLWNIQNRDVPHNVLYRLYEVARRIGNRLDERLETALDALERL